MDPQYARSAAGQSNAIALVATAAVMLILSWSSIFLRGYVRTFLTKSFQLDDWVMLLSQVGYHAYSLSLVLKNCRDTGD
jgi:hypothetical protein